MKVVFNSAAASGAAFSGFYASPEVRVVYFTPEGFLCGSVTGSGHDDFTVGGEYDLYMEG